MMGLFENWGGYWERNILFMIGNKESSRGGGEILMNGDLNVVCCLQERVHMSYRFADSLWRR